MAREAGRVDAVVVDAGPFLTLTANSRGGLKMGQGKARHPILPVLFRPSRLRALAYT